MFWGLSFIFQDAFLKIWKKSTFWLRRPGDLRKHISEMSSCRLNPHDRCRHTKHSGINQTNKQTSFFRRSRKSMLWPANGPMAKKLKNRFDSCSKKSFYTNCNFLPKLDLPRNLHSGNLTFAIANGPFEDVFPMKNGDIPASYVSLPEGRPSSESISHLQEGFQPRSPHCHPQPLLEASKSPPGPNDTTTRFWKKNIVALKAISLSEYLPEWPFFLRNQCHFRNQKKSECSVFWNGGSKMISASMERWTVHFPKLSNGYHLEVAHFCDKKSPSQWENPEDLTKPKLGWENLRNRALRALPLPAPRAKGCIFHTREIRRTNPNKPSQHSARHIRETTGAKNLANL